MRLIAEKKSFVAAMTWIAEWVISESLEDSVFWEINDNNNCRCFGFMSELKALGFGVEMCLQ